MLSPLSLSQLAHHSAPAGIPVAASPCTSPQRRTGATPHSPHAQCGRMACGSQAAKAQSRRPCNPSTCTCHATASPQRASFQRPACHGCIVCVRLCAGPSALAQSEVSARMMMMTPRFHKNAAKSCHTKRTTYHAQAPALLTAPVLTRYPRHRLVQCPLSCVPPLTCRPAPRVPA